MFVVAVPTAVAQSPLGDQYQTDESVPGSSAAAAAGPEVAVDVQETSAGADGSLPFTGGQIALVALLGLGLVGLGVVGVAISRRHESPTAS
jgi:hypothetical protein